MRPPDCLTLSDGLKETGLVVKPGNGGTNPLRSYREKEIHERNGVSSKGVREKKQKQKHRAQGTSHQGSQAGEKQVWFDLGGGLYKRNGTKGRSNELPPGHLRKR